MTESPFPDVPDADEPMDRKMDPNGETVIIDSPLEADAAGSSSGVSPTQPWWSWIVDRNPLFLLSGISMFAGCFAISRAIHAEPDDPQALWMLLGLLGVLNLYELMVIALGLLLSRSAALVRDARHLLGLALLLMIDVGFVYHESATASLTAGVIIGAAAAALGLAKTYAITRGVGVRLSHAALGLIGADLAAVFFLPVVMRWIAGDGFVSPGAMLGVFSAMGLLIALHALPSVWVRSMHAAGADRRQLQQLVRGGVLLLPVLSAVAHVAVGPWVYGTGYTSAYLAPLLLGLAVVVARQMALAGWAESAAGTAGVLAAAAVVSTLRVPGEMIGLVEWPVDVYVSPLRGALLASAGLAVWLALRHGAWKGYAGGGLCVMFATLGHTPRAMVDRVGYVAQEGWDLVRGMTPSSQLEWGVLGVGCAFLLLALGAAMSLWRHRRGGLGVGSRSPMG